MLISAVLPIMSLYRLPHGQYGYNGHVINLPQDVACFVHSLPRLPSDVDVIIVRKEGATQSHRDFRVRRSVVLGALQWLIENNKYYRSVTIDSDALALLPEDGDISGLCAVTLDTPHEDQPIVILQTYINIVWPDFVLGPSVIIWLCRWNHQPQKMKTHMMPTCQEHSSPVLLAG